MRTKTLIIASAALAVGILTSSAQTYSQNIVGYVNQVLPAGYSLIALPVNTTNIATIDAGQALPCLQGGDSVIIWNGGGYSTYGFLNAGPGLTWQYPDGSFSDTAPQLKIGQGFFYSNGQSGPETNTFAGTVILSQSTSLVAGYSMVASAPPVAGALDGAVFNLPYQSGDSIILWNGGGFSTYGYLNAGPGLTWQYPDGSFSDTAPSVSVGQGIFYSNGQSGPEAWTQTLVVP
jgi:hypothetical protein